MAMHGDDPPALSYRNNWCCVRHGESEANVAEIVSCSPDTACIQHGLTRKGIEQVQAAGEVLRQQVDEVTDIVIVSSDFRRTNETSSTLTHTLGISETHPVSTTGGEGARNSAAGVASDIRLRERDFGRFEGGRSVHYNDVWELDCGSNCTREEADARLTEWGVELVDCVLSRAVQVVEEVCYCCCHYLCFMCFSRSCCNDVCVAG